MKKTRTITYHASINNGSFFQSYALQTFLLKTGIDNQIINLQTNELKRDYELFRSIKSLRDLFKNIVSLINYKSLSKRKKNFVEARKHFLKETVECQSFEEYKKLESNFEEYIYIAGSDQIWNVNASDFSEDYFLPSIKNKITYSASGGSKITAKDLIPYKELIEEFNHISVRENDLRKELLSFIDAKHISVTVDPTILLDKDEYTVFCKSEPLAKGEYIFLYTVKCDNNILLTAKQISKKLRLPVYAVFTTYKSALNFKYGIHNINNAGPREFINLIYNAKLVLTDSFHGTVFSIILEKNFRYIANIDSDNLIIRDDRIDYLLEELELTNMRVSALSSFNINDLNKEYSFNKANEHIKKLREDSIEYLLSSIQNNMQ